MLISVLQLQNKKYLEFKYIVFFPPHMMLHYHKSCCALNHPTVLYLLYMSPCIQELSLIKK